MSYAKGTKTSIEKSETDIKLMLRKAGAERIAVLEEPDQAQVAFELNQRSIKFRLPLPRRGDPRFVHKIVFGKPAAEHPKSTQDNLWAQACRERWRQLHLCIKAKLEAVEQNIETFDEAFLPHIVTPDGRTVGDVMLPELENVLEGRPLPKLLGHG